MSSPKKGLGMKEGSKKHCIIGPSLYNLRRRETVADSLGINTISSNHWAVGGRASILFFLVCFAFIYSIRVRKNGGIFGKLFAYYYFLSRQFKNRIQTQNDRFLVRNIFRVFTFFSIFLHFHFITFQVCFLLSAVEQCRSSGALLRSRPPTALQSSAALPRRLALPCPWPSVLLPLLFRFGFRRCSSVKASGSGSRIGSPPTSTLPIFGSSLCSANLLLLRRRPFSATQHWRTAAPAGETATTAVQHRAEQSGFRSVGQ